MNTVVGSWKYIFKNLWSVLPFALVPGVFLALALDHSAASAYLHGFLAGDPRPGFLVMLRTFGVIRMDSWLGGVFTVCAFLTVAVFAALMLSFAEKHMRLGKRTASGLLRQFLNVLPSAFLLTFFYTALFETYAIILSAILFVLSAIPATPLVYVLDVAAVLFFTFALLYVASLFYLWFQMTGFGMYDSLLYSYRLAAGVRSKLILSFALSYAVLFAALAGAALLPYYAYLIVAAVLMIFCFLSFCIRMLTVYFETDKLDREDLLHNYRGYRL